MYLPVHMRTCCCGSAMDLLLIVKIEPVIHLAQCQCTLALENVFAVFLGHHQLGPILLFSHYFYFIFVFFF